MGYLSSLANNFLSNALAPTTFISYKHKYRIFKSFCRRNGLQHLPLSEDTLVLFATYLAARGLQVNTIRIYMSALRFHSIRLGLPCSFQHMARLYYTLRGIKRSDYSSPRPPRLPITMLHLVNIHTRLHQYAASKSEFCLYWSACTLAFFGLLRVSEYTTQKILEYDYQSNLLRSDVCIIGSTMHVNIKASKTDPFKVGCKLIVGSTHDLVCPVLAMRLFLRHRRLSVGPLYTFTDGTFLTRNRVARLLLHCFNDPRINTHSFRIGGATALSQAGVSDSLIQSLGRWNSNCFIRYLRPPPQLISEFARRMANTPLGSYVWDPEHQLEEHESTR